MTWIRRQAAGLAVLLALGGMATLAHGQVQDPGGPDLDVASIELVAPPGGPAWVHGVPSGPMDVRVRVVNNGNLASAGYRLDYHWVKGGQATWLNGNEESSFGVGRSLAPKVSQVDDLQWQLRQGQDGIGVIRVTLRPAGADRDSGNNVESYFLSIPAHWVTLDVVGQDQALRFPEETRFVRVQLVNDGNTDETVRLAVTDAGDDSRLDETLESAELTVPARSSRSTTLFVHFLSPDDERPFSVTYGIHATTAYGRSLDATTPTFASSTQNLTKGSPATLQPVDTVSLALDPGGQLRVPVRLTNTGDTSDTYLIDASTSGAGWTATAERPRIALDAGESALFTVPVDALPSVDKGSTSTLRVRYQSARDETFELPAPSLDIPLRIHGPAVRLEPAAGWPRDPYLGDSLGIPVRLVNHGDQPTPGEEAGATVTLQIKGAGAWVETVSLPVPAVQPGKDAVVRFQLPGRLENPLRAGVARVQADWDAPGQSIAKQGLASSILVHKPVLTITAPQGLDGAPGTAVGYRTLERSFSVRNDGNAEETFVLSMAADRGQASILLDSLQLTLAPQENRSVTFEHRLPLPAGNATSAQAQLTAAVAGRNDLAWRASVTTTINDTVPPTLRAYGPFPKEWTLGEPLPFTVEAHDDSAVARVAWNHTTPMGSSTIQNLTRAAKAGVWEGSIPIEMPGMHRVTVLAYDTRGHATTLVLPGVNASVIPPPAIRRVGEVPREVDADHVFRIKVDDVRPVASVSLKVTNRTGTVVATKELDLDANGTAAFDLQGVPAGPLTLAIQARNNAGAHSELVQEVVLRSPPAAPASANNAEEAPSPGLLVALAALAMAVRRGPPRWPNRILQG